MGFFKRQPQYESKRANQPIKVTRDGKTFVLRRFRQHRNRLKALGVRSVREQRSLIREAASKHAKFSFKKRGDKVAIVDEDAPVPVEEVTETQAEPTPQQPQQVTRPDKRSSPVFAQPPPFTPPPLVMTEAPQPERRGSLAFELFGFGDDSAFSRLEKLSFIQQRKLREKTTGVSDVPAMALVAGGRFAKGGGAALVALSDPVNLVKDTLTTSPFAVGAEIKQQLVTDPAYLIELAGDVTVTGKALDVAAKPVVKVFREFKDVPKRGDDPQSLGSIREAQRVRERFTLETARRGKPAKESLPTIEAEFKPTESGELVLTKRSIKEQGVPVFGKQGEVKTGRQATLTEGGGLDITTDLSGAPRARAKAQPDVLEAVSLRERVLAENVKISEQVEATIKEIGLQRTGDVTPESLAALKRIDPRLLEPAQPLSGQKIDTATQTQLTGVRDVFDLKFRRGIERGVFDFESAALRFDPAEKILVEFQPTQQPRLGLDTGVQGRFRDTRLKSFKGKGQASLSLPSVEFVSDFFRDPFFKDFLEPGKPLSGRGVRLPSEPTPGQITPPKVRLGVGATPGFFVPSVSAGVAEGLGLGEGLGIRADVGEAQAQVSPPEQVIIPETLQVTKPFIDVFEDTPTKPRLRQPQKVEPKIDIIPVTTSRTRRRSAFFTPTRPKSITLPPPVIDPGVPTPPPFFFRPKTKKKKKRGRGAVGFDLPTSGPLLTLKPFSDLVSISVTEAATGRRATQPAITPASISENIRGFKAGRVFFPTVEMKTGRVKVRGL